MRGVVSGSSSSFLSSSPFFFSSLPLSFFFSSLPFFFSSFISCLPLPFSSFFSSSGGQKRSERQPQQHFLHSAGFIFRSSHFQCLSQSTWQHLNKPPNGEQPVSQDAHAGAAQPPVVPET